MNTTDDRESNRQTAFVFPGQGSQKPGMGRDLVRRWPALIGTRYGPADEILGFPLSELCWEATAEVLRDTAVTQPAVFLTSLAVLDVLRDHGLRPDVVAGHSLGEYTALVCAGVLDWTDALRLVRHRGVLMAELNAEVPGGMAAVMGLDLSRVEAICIIAAAVTGQAVEVANDNAPGQVVVSGQSAAVAEAIRIAERSGARRAVALDVGAPFHCGLMSAIEERFAAELARVDFRDPEIPVVSSVTGQYVTSGEEAAECLRTQLAGPVRWTATVRRMAGAGAGVFVEVGPGRVLGGLCRRIAPGIPVRGTGDALQLAQALDGLLSPAGSTAA